MFAFIKNILNKIFGREERDPQCFHNPRLGKVKVKLFNGNWSVNGEIHNGPCEILVTDDEDLVIYKVQ